MKIILAFSNNKQKQMFSDARKSILRHVKNLTYIIILTTLKFELVDNLKNEC